MDQLIRLFVSDIDGCLGEPYQPFDGDKLIRLASYARKAADGQAGYPPISICSGRAFGYVEAMSQFLHLVKPVAFEAGAGIFDPVGARISWHPLLDEDRLGMIREVRGWMSKDVAPGTGLSLDFAKKSQAGLIGPNIEEVQARVPIVRRFVEDNFPGLFVARTDWSIDVLLPELTKKEGIKWLADTCAVPIDQVAFIGDTGGDLQALELVGHSFAPSNAEETVRNSVNRVTDSPVIDGTLEAYEWCVTYNASRTR